MFREFPMEPVVMTSVILKNIAKETDDQKISERLHELAKPLFDLREMGRFLLAVDAGSFQELVNPSSL
jgi:hypothetical protein